jgi:hypothetical protein
MEIQLGLHEELAEEWQQYISNLKRSAIRFSTEEDDIIWSKINSEEYTQQNWVMKPEWGKLKRARNTGGGNLYGSLNIH